MLSRDHLFCLGALDPEMAMIECLLLSKGYRVELATRSGRRCLASNAYRSDTLLKTTRPDQPAVWVESRSTGFDESTDLIADHHNPGDPGYDAAPADFWLGSSIGQVSELVGGSYVELRYAAAGDHCLSAALRGECPGVDPLELMNWRVGKRAAMAGIPSYVLRRRIDRACSRLDSLPRLLIGGVEVVDASFVRTPELRDAAAWRCLPLLSTKLTVTGQVKIGLHGVGPGVLSDWLRAMSRADAVTETYGNPHREFGKAILTASASALMLDSLDRF